MAGVEPARVLILGDRGLLGAELKRVLPEWFRVAGADLPACDIRSRKSVDAALSRFRPGVVINAAAYTDVDGCEKNPELARRVNSEAPGTVARACRRRGASMVQISTDFIFAGRARRPYTERSRPAPINNYGRSKLAGEEAVRRSAPGHLIVRTSWLFGEGGKNFIDTILARASNPGRLSVVDDQTGSPTWGRHLALGIARLLRAGAGGTVNVTNTGWTNWFDYARFIVSEAGLPARVVPISSRELSRPARRPAFSALSPERYRELTGETLPSWREAVREYLRARGFGG